MQWMGVQEIERDSQLVTLLPLSIQALLEAQFDGKVSHFCISLIFGSALSLFARILCEFWIIGTDLAVCERITASGCCIRNLHCVFCPGVKTAYRE